MSEEDEWESAADNFQVNLTISHDKDEEDEWENGVDEFVVSGTEIKSQVAGLPTIRCCPKYISSARIQTLSNTAWYHGNLHSLCQWRTWISWI